MSITKDEENPDLLIKHEWQVAIKERDILISTICAGLRDLGKGIVNETVTQDQIAIRLIALLMISNLYYDRPISKKQDRIAGDTAREVINQIRKHARTV